MAKLHNRIDNALNESRILILSAQVLLGFQFSAVFTRGFPQLPQLTRYLNVGALGLLLVVLALLIAPAAYNRIVEQGEETEDLERFIILVIALALVPFAAALGINLFIATEKLAGRTAGMVAGVSTALTAGFFWYGIEVVRRWILPRADSGTRTRNVMHEHAATTAGQEDSQASGTPLSHKVTNVLTEARMVLPGVQALLGFQFGIMLAEGFQPLPLSSKYVHLASIALTALSTILLITPAAYHRIVEQGEDTEYFHDFASRMVLAAMAPLALSVSGDFYVVVREVSGSAAWAITLSGLLLLLFFGLWFGFTTYRRARLPRKPALPD